MYTLPRVCDCTGFHLNFRLFKYFKMPFCTVVIVNTEGLLVTFRRDLETLYYYNVELISLYLLCLCWQAVYIQTYKLLMMSFAYIPKDANMMTVHVDSPN